MSNLWKDSKGYKSEGMMGIEQINSELRDLNWSILQTKLAFVSDDDLFKLTIACLDEMQRRYD